MSDLPPSRRDEREAELAAIIADFDANGPRTVEIIRLIAEVRSLSQQLDDATQKEDGLRASLKTHANLLYDANDEIARLGTDAKRFGVIREHYVAADFVYPQYEGRSCLIIALPVGTRVGADLDATVDGIPASPRA